jgi:predicted component of type VI protein secretion system
MNPSFRLVMQTGPTPGRDIPLQKSELFVGRDSSNDIVINDAEVSRRHARFFLQGTSYMLEDLGSTNGSFINGQRLVGPTPVRPGEIITLGERINLVFESLTFSQPPVAAFPSATPIPPLSQPEPSAPPQASPLGHAPVIPQPVARSEPLQAKPSSSSTFSGHVPSAGLSPVPAPVIKTRIPAWVWIVIAVLTILLIFLIIDDARLWCPLFGWAINGIFPGNCPL